MSKNENKTIAIIDSGIGGVAVLKQIIAKYKYGNYIYFADNLNMPYGNKNKVWLKKRLVYIIEWLKDEFKINHIIIACNTASAVLKEIDIPNVTIMNFDKEKTYYATKLTQINMPELNVIADKTLAEQIEKDILNRKLLISIIKKHIKQNKLNELQEFVLGCTHYELVEKLFKKYCPKTNVICNSSFMLNEIKLQITQNELNIIVKLSKNDFDLENKIRKLLNGLN